MVLARTRRRSIPIAVLLTVVATLLVPAAPAHAARAATFAATVAAIEALPYQPVYVPLGFDAAFPDALVLNVPPANDYSAGSIPGSPTAPAWPSVFKPVTITSTDGAKLLGMVAVHPGPHPGVVVAHGFNTNGKLSSIRWAAMLAASGYEVVAFDQRDFAAEYQAGLGYPAQRQTLGWKETQDVLAAAAYLRSRPGVTGIGLVGFSEGAQNSILAVGRDPGHLIDAAITFSPPADLDSQIYGGAIPPGCQTPLCTFPLTAAQVLAGVPPYTFATPCAMLEDAAARYGTTAYGVLAQESAIHAQTMATVPLLNIYSNDDSFVAPWNAGFMAAYEQGSPLQQTILIASGEHAYFFDRWWQQAAILTYFHFLVPGGSSASTTPTVNQTPLGAPLSSQLVPIATPSRAAADAALAPFVCDT